MKYLITGGCGFIGSNYILQLLRRTRHIAVANVDCLTYAGRKENLVSVEDDNRYTFYKEDIRDAEAMNRVFETEKPDVVIAFAAESHVDRSIKSADAFITTNINGTYTLLEAALRRPPKLFIQIGTDEVYGQIPAPRSSSETDSLDPRSPYSASKASSDLIALAYYSTHGLPVIVTRCCNNYGPRQFPEKLIPLFITNLMEDKKVPVYGDGKQVREWIHVDDHCRAVDHIIEHGVPGEIYNIGSGVGDMTNLDITYRLLGLMFKDESHIEYVEDRKGHDRRYSINCNKLRQQLKWQPAHSFDIGMEETVHWYQNNVEWWRPLKNG